MTDAEARRAPAGRSSAVWMSSAMLPASASRTSGRRRNYSAATFNSSRVFAVSVWTSGRSRSS